MTPEEKLAALEKKKAEIAAKIQRVKNKVSKKKRQEDTRKKILIGAMILAKIKANEMTENELLKMLDNYLTTDRDRKLFNLPIQSD